MLSGFGGYAAPSPGLVDLIAVDGSIRLTQSSAFLYGGRLSIWPSKRVGFELESSYLPSDAELRAVVFFPGMTEASLADSSFPGWIQYYSANLQVAIISPPLDPLVVFLSTGIGIVRRGGDFYDANDLHGLTDIAGSFGIGGRYGVARGINIRMDFRDYIYSFKFTDSDLEAADPEVQGDLQVTAGVEIVLLK
jgi:hypothetical protein